MAQCHASVLDLEDAIESIFPSESHQHCQLPASCFEFAPQVDLGLLLRWEDDEASSNDMYLMAKDECAERQYDNSDCSSAQSQSPVQIHPEPLLDNVPKYRRQKKRQAKIQGSVQMRWSKEEHNRFLEGVARFCPYAELSRSGDGEGRVFVGLGPGIAQAIACVVGTRTELQVRSHAQKYFLKESSRRSN
ncbi:hypothetical protein GUITHDRAFT_116484 [Guillardia theta CCMP2712]|uniref:Uncharacterized protein n=1 Tax=Guillardia theta (strain CCMP2712) TaxID=905079 RepID=L1IMA1_GUITC|nr:hypothetical protein GUITHDRAFT_116484 [Guillardia theta CCMP2712]EKX37371.1 hypothetical protein GUITHDRAFT_116484 [Guillardia theta CCMP2712]|eukprot:XP_005824351.1 hypothetical protein GUITHDRAFT_116484 [Guillardia theta CCMP2712]